MSDTTDTKTTPIDDLTRLEQKEVKDFIKAACDVFSDNTHINIPKIISEAMEMVEIIGRRESLGGQFKKSIVSYITECILNECHIVLDTGLIGDSVDVIVAANQNKLDINTTGKYCVSCIPVLFSCLCFPNRSKKKHASRKAAEKKAKKAAKKEAAKKKAAEKEAAKKEAAEKKAAEKKAAEKKAAEKKAAEKKAAEKKAKKSTIEKTNNEDKDIVELIKVKNQSNKYKVVGLATIVEEAMAAQASCDNDDNDKEVVEDDYEEGNEEEANKEEISDEVANANGCTK